MWQIRLASGCNGFCTTQQQGQSVFFLDPFGAFGVQNPSQLRPEDVKKILNRVCGGYVRFDCDEQTCGGNGNAKYKIITKDDKEYDVLKIYRDPTNDIAILKVDASLNALPLGDSSNVKVGQSVIAIELRLTVSAHRDNRRGLWSWSRYYAGDTCHVLQNDLTM